MLDYYGIDIFTPGTDYDDIVDANVASKSAIYVLLSFLFMLLVTFIAETTLIAAGLIRFVIDGIYIHVVYEPYSLLIITAVSEPALIIGPLYYIKTRQLSRQAIGFKKRIKWSEVPMGFALGAAMITLNIIITWFIASIMGSDTETPSFAISGILELAGWVIVMFAIVGISEEVLFRGFLQRRLDDYLGTRTKHNTLAAIVVTSLLFSFLHLDLIGFITRFLLGVILGWLAKQYNYSIVAPATAHGLNNAIVVILVFLQF